MQSVLIYPNSFEFEQSSPFKLSKDGVEKNPRLNPCQNWKLTEQTYYSICLQYYYSKRKADFKGNRAEQWSFYHFLSSYLITRNPNQCRIYHNYQLKKQTSNQGIIQTSRKLIKNFQALLQKEVTRLNRLYKSHEMMIKKTSKKILKNNIAIGQNIKLLEQNVKKHQQLVATGIEYEEQQIVPQKKVRCSFDFDDEIQNYSYAGTGNCDTKNKEEMMMDCHESFKDWMGKLTNLMSSK